MTIREYGGEFDWDSNAPWLRADTPAPWLGDARFFRSGRDALRAVARRHRIEYRRALLPALCSTAMTIPFRESGYELRYFRLRPDGRADAGDLMDKITPGTLLVTMNYFGIRSLSDETIPAVRKLPGPVLWIRERTHDLFEKDEEPPSDYSLCSIRKWLALPDGGLLWSRDDEQFPTVRDRRYARIRRKAFREKSRYLAHADPVLKDRFQARLAWADELLDAAAMAAAMSPSSRHILERFNFEAMARRRTANCGIYRDRLRSSGDIGLPDLRRDAVPLHFPILLSHRDAVRQNLARRGVYCPVLWPLPPDAAGVDPVSDDLSRRILALPCDQRYGEGEIRHILWAVLQSTAQAKGLTP